MLSRTLASLLTLGLPVNSMSNYWKSSTQLETKLKAEFGSWWQPISPDPAKCVFIPKKDNKRLGYLEGYPIKKYKLVEFNPGSRDHIARVLQERGWKPTEVHAGGQPPAGRGDHRGRCS
jgi:hypothetical protein